MDGECEVKEILQNAELNRYVTRNLQDTLSSIGYSRGLLEDLLHDLERTDIAAFIRKHAKELHEIHGVHFFEELVPAYFDKYVIPEIPAFGKVVDLGCGTGMLARRLGQEREEEVIGADINEYPEWKRQHKPNVRFEVVPEDEAMQFLVQQSPRSVVMTWALHHMEYSEQERYLSATYEALRPGSNLVVLEDAYSEKLVPENGQAAYEEFMRWSKEDRKNIMSVYDWIANRVLEQRDKVPMPFAYRTIEEWSDLFKQIGFRDVRSRFIGLPTNRDINTPQSLLVAVKRVTGRRDGSNTRPAEWPRIREIENRNSI